VAVKVIKPWWSEDPYWVLSFEREAQLLARVHDPGIVQIFDVGHAAEGLYYVAELVDGESLASHLRQGQLPSSDACDVAEQLCRALAQAHAKCVVHRDVKPANVLISADGRVKIADFGVARLAEGTTDGAAATIVGTPRYMAPEQARGLRTTPATDVYGVGIVLYEMLAGRPPFIEKSAVELALRHLQDPPPPLPPSTPQLLVEIVDRALAKNPATRYPNGAAMADALAQARESISDQQISTAPGTTAGALATLTPATIFAVARPAATPATRVLRNGDRAAEAASATHHPTSSGHEAATGSLMGTGEGVAPTRVAAPMTPRLNVNPSARRRNAAAFALVFLVLLGMVAAAIVIAPGGRVSVPYFRGLSRASIAAKASHVNLQTAFGARYDQAPRGIAITQSPSPGTRVADGTTVRVELSAGPPPVEVPRFLDQPSANAQATLQRLGLHASLTQVPAPGVGGGIVIRQSPAAGANLSAGSSVALSVAETPRWRPLTSFAGDGNGRSVPFRIRGTRWQVVYSMGYEGTCTLLFICSGPSAKVANLHPGSNATQFDLNDGSDQTQRFESGPGLYQISVAPGSDTARWSIEIEDYY
jgi:serine/threonine-protein kinase